MKHNNIINELAEKRRELSSLEEWKLSAYRS